MVSHIPGSGRPLSRLATGALLVISLVSAFGITGVVGAEEEVHRWMEIPDFVMNRIDTATLPESYYPGNLSDYQNEAPDAMTYVTEGNDYLTGSSYAAAKNAFEEAINRYPDSFDAWLGRGYALEGLNRILSAEDSYDKAISLSAGEPKAWAAYAGKGRLLSGQKRYREAVGAFNSAISLCKTGFCSPGDLAGISAQLAGAEDKAGNRDVAAAGYIRLERDACYGTCPVYSVTLFPNGSVLYTGKEYVKEAGTREGSINESAYNDLINRFRRDGFYAMNDTYDEYFITDLPSATLTVCSGNLTKTVEHYSGDESAPEVLAQLEEAVDQAAGTDHWTQIPAADQGQLNSSS
jgi:tetratricopeptide (TPR) repeat protein